MNLWVRTYSYEYSTKKKLYFRSVDFRNKYKCYRYFFIIKLARPSVQSASVCVKAAAILLKFFLSFSHGARSIESNAETLDSIRAENLTSNIAGRSSVSLHVKYGMHQ